MLLFSCLQTWPQNSIRTTSFWAEGPLRSYAQLLLTMHYKFTSIHLDAKALAWTLRQEKSILMESGKINSSLVISIYRQLQSDNMSMYLQFQFVRLWWLQVKVCQMMHWRFTIQHACKTQITRKPVVQSILKQLVSLFHIPPQWSLGNIT